MRSSLLLLTLLPVLPCSAQTKLQSAREILDFAAPTKEQPSWEGPGEYSNVDESETYADTSLGQWQRDARALRKNSARNTPAQNAKAWLDLAARRMTLPVEKSRTRPDFGQLVNALPSPSSWPEILKLARANYVQSPNEVNASNLYFAARLQNDAATQTEALRGLYRILAPQFQQALQKYSSPNKQNGEALDYEAQRNARTAFTRFDSFGSLLLESPSREQQKIGVQWKVKSSTRGDQYSQFDVPDLVSLLGEANAKPLLRQILLLPTQPNWNGAGKTADLARRMWLSDAQIQRRPLWKLPYSNSDWKFALAMLRKFPGPPSDGDWYTLSPVRTSALTGTLTNGQYAQATQLINSWLKVKPKGKATLADEASNARTIYFPYSPENEARPAKLQRLNWVENTLKAHPQLPWWDSYRSLSLQLGETPSRLRLLQSTAGQSGFAKWPRADRYIILNALSAAYLDSDDVQRGGDTLVRALQLSLASKDGVDTVGSDVGALLRLTRVVPNANWMQTARQGAQHMFAVAPTYMDEDAAKSRTLVALHLAEQKQSVFAHSLLAKAYRAQMKAAGKQEAWQSNSTSGRTYLYGLMSIYKDANRPADMVYLLEHARGWGEKELTPLLEFNTLSQWDYSPEDPETKTLPRLGYLAAWGLAKTKRGVQASQILRALIERQGGYDPAYRLLCDVEGERANAFLQEQAARDRFEERPLIWRAFLARRAGKLGQAQQLAQAAIAIDPSDGEEGRGDRLRAYAELGAALRAQGKVAEAQKVENAVRAIRLAEDADYLRIAGLTTRAINLYKRSLSFFDDAYCVQSRLAVQLVGLGRYEEAAQHFRRAYELMPYSFGRLESHCFGCEGVFGGKSENGIARQVFMQLERSRPNDPKVAYLSGYWRSTSGQRREAVRYFERAVSLDPLYLSAWKQLSYTSDLLTPAQSDRTTLKLLELDPRGIHEGQGWGVSYEVKHDYRGLWNTTQLVLPRKNPRLKANFPLPASQSNGGGNWDTWELIRHPSGAISTQAFVTRLSTVTA